MLSTPLTCLEEYMLSDDRPSYPMTCAFRLQFSGHLDRTAWEKALDTVIHRHPLLRAKVGRVGRRWVWIDQPDWRPEVIWDSNVNPHGFPEMRYIDLLHESGTRTWVIDRGQTHEAVLQVHHACTDALGAARLLEDLLVDYSSRVIDDKGSSSLIDLNFESFRRRGAPGMTVGRFFSQLHKQAVGLLGVRDFLSRKPRTICPAMENLDPSIPPRHFPCSQRVVLSRELTRHLLTAAKEKQVTLNDLLLCDMFYTIAQWRMKHNFGTDQDWLRFSVPMNLRQARDAGMPMANSISLVFLDRRPADCLEPDTLLQGIHEQMQTIKRNELQYTFLYSLGVTRLLPGGLRARAKSQKCELSSVFSNLGPVLHQVPLPQREGRLLCGNVELQEVDLVIPLRPFVHASFCVYTYGGCLNVLMHPDERVLSRDQWATLLHAFVEQIQQTANAVTTPVAVDPANSPRD